MNCWTKRTQELTERDYLDQLTTIYKARSGQPKILPPQLKEALRDLYAKFEESPNEHADDLLDLLYRIREVHERFAFNHPYVPMLRNREIRSKNPEVKKILIDEIRKRGLNSLIAHLEAPPELNRQMGSMFKNWVKQKLPKAILGLAKEKGVSLAVSVVQISVSRGKLKESIIFTENTGQGNNARQELVIFTGGDDALQKKVRQSASISDFPTTKGIDFLALANGWSLLGEAKFQSDVGGNQDNQKIVGEIILNFGINVDQKVAGLFFFDGMPVIRRYEGLDLRDDHVVMSALLLPALLVGVVERGGAALTESC